MRIKKLTIHGFKSFVDKVTLNFPSGTSGIIGPNGCGKSNIVDAIRWVLGEQNARHLRGKHMEDIIFNGSEARKPLGMAEVVLTFANDEGKAPAKFANFTEIEISRRLYRSGESEYYINKVQSRLRDIVDLFTDTGIGTRAYSIIEQGQVGWLINAKAEERRAIFEEAAGINKFKHKKDAALRRLEATRENLTRVNDIISEVKRQLNSLNRQAKKAERYKALKEELQKVELLLSSLELKRIQGELDGLHKKLESIKDEELAVTNGVNERERLIEEVKLDYLNAEGEYKAIREKVFELEKLIQGEERNNALFKMRVEELNRAEERLSIEIEELKRTSGQAAGELESLRSSLIDITSFIEEQTNKLNSNTRELEAIVNELRTKEEAQRAEKAESLKITTRLSDIRHTLQSCIRDEEHLRIREAKASSEKEEVIRALSSNEEPLTALRARVTESEGMKGSMEAQLTGIRESLQSLEKDKVGKAEELKKIKDEHARAAAKLATLEEMDRNFESLKGGAKAIMLKGKNERIYGLIADVIETNPGFEKAVEAILGERLQYVLVESMNEGIEAIEYLKKNGAGRGSFVPLKEARASLPVPVQSLSYGSGAKELIGELKIKDGYSNIVNSLLGDVLIVENLQTGVELWKESGAYKTIVTLEGEVIDAQGIITGGSSAGTDGILQKRGEIKKIRSEVTELAAALNATEAAFKAIEEEISKTQSSLEGLRERLHSIEIEKVNASNELKRLDDEVSRLGKTKDNLEAEIADAGRRLADIVIKKGDLSEERDALERGFNEREGKIAATAAEISALIQKKDSLNQIVTEIRVSLAQARERSESVKKQIADKERSIEESSRRTEAKLTEIERGKAEAEEKLQSMEEIKDRLEELLGNIDEVKREEVSRGEHLNSLTDKVRGIENELKDLKSRYAELQELKGELTIESKELDLAIRNLRERVLEKYSTHIAQYTQEEGAAVPDTGALQTERDDIREKITSLGEVSLSALEEYAQLETRHQFLLDQQADLTKSVDALHAAITRINRTTREKFRATFDEINAKFQETFPKFFSGGKAELRLTEGDDILEAGVEIVAQPPGKRLQNITLLSGGEKALTATSLIFAIFLIKPSPFCLLDEVDAPLDDANIDRFNLFVREMSELSQFLLITHNKKTMEMADALYGITMQQPGISKVVTLKF